MDSIDDIRVYKNAASWWGEARDDATLRAMGKVQGYDWFVHPMSDLWFGIPEGTNVVFLSSAASGDLESQIKQQNLALAQASLDAFVRGGGTLIAGLADNHPRGGYLVPGAMGTPDFLLPSDCRALRFGTAAYGKDFVPGTPDDHELTHGADGIAGTLDDLRAATVSLAEGCAVVHGNLVDGLQMPPHAKVLMTADFGRFEAPVLAEYTHGAGRVILTTITLESAGQQPAGAGPTTILISLFGYALGQHGGQVRTGGGIETPHPRDPSFGA